MGLIDAFKRWQLAKKGLSSGKKRRVQNEASVSGSLDRSIWVRFSLYLTFCVSAAVIVMRALAVGEEGAVPLSGSLFAFCLAVSAVTVIELNHTKITERNGRVVLLLGGILAQLALIRGMHWVEASNHLPEEVGFLLTPFVLAPMLHAVLLGGPAGVFSAVYVSLLGTLLVQDDGKTLFMAVSLLSGLVAALTLRRTRRRVQLLRAGFYSGLMAFMLSALFGVVNLGAGTMDDWRMIGQAAAAALGMGIGTALLVSGFLPVLEGMFQLTTDISWLELSDLNHRLLKRMQLEAPGTFHHSLVVASLSESAAEAVGANAALCRVCAYFHDVGKLSKPEYFIENQGDGVENPHDSLTPTMSALIIVAHVKDGVDLALKHRLNPRVINVIREHHGDSLVSYFYRKAQEQKRDEIEKVEKKLENPEDLPKIDQKNFRYPGPRPRSRESGIISLADAIESASRTLKKPTPAKIRALVEDLVEKRICDGQLDDCELTMKDLAVVKSQFCKTLRSMLHSRIDYPKDEKGAKSDAGRGSDAERREKRKKSNKTQQLPPPHEVTKAKKVAPVAKAES
ncbi:HDIG domain-containing metalloprotein [Haloferula rosea]|uniref:HDIG domain-containing protein n=1 Tax=Haloferula rosea TaxID=490093 RepID=A0A934RHH4_9BACT|nr:HDIG domain-containing metalloprotein [Haloferula rosea]MBK1828420.1 HDIG domain-containing protein [Haloferula rosea]